MKKVLSKEEFVKKALSDLAASNKLIKVVAPSMCHKRKMAVKRRKCGSFEFIERIVTYV